MCSTWSATAELDEQDVRYDFLAVTLQLLIQNGMQLALTQFSEFYVELGYCNLPEILCINMNSLSHSISNKSACFADSNDSNYLDFNTKFSISETQKFSSQDSISEAGRTRSKVFWVQAPWSVYFHWL